MFPVFLNKETEKQKGDRMSNIVLIACSNKKSKTKTQARYLYRGTEFMYSLSYTEEKIKPEKIFILSAKYGLLDLDDEIEHYNYTLKQKSQEIKKEWAKSVFEKLKNKCDVGKDTFIILAGKDYYLELLPYLKKTEIPMAKLNMYQRVPWLKVKLDE